MNGNASLLGIEERCKRVKDLLLRSAISMHRSLTKANNYQAGAILNHKTGAGHQKTAYRDPLVPKGLCPSDSPLLPPRARGAGSFRRRQGAEFSPCGPHPAHGGLS